MNDVLNPIELSFDKHIENIAKELDYMREEMYKALGIPAEPKADTRTFEERLSDHLDKLCYFESCGIEHRHYNRLERIRQNLLYHKYTNSRNFHPITRKIFDQIAFT